MGILGGQKINVRETAEKINTFLTPTPPGVGVFMGIGPTFQMSGTFRELSRKSIFFLALPHGLGWVGRDDNFKVTRPKHQVLESISGKQLS